jgi:di/tricarboxylate transporter
LGEFSAAGQRKFVSKALTGQEHAPMSQSSTILAPAGRTTGPTFHWWRVAVPVLIALALAALPPPAGLAQHAWLYFALFAGVIAALVTEPLPNPAVGLVGLSLAALLSPYVLFAPADLAKPGFKLTSATITWALSGFSSTTVWLVGGAFMFALGYEKSGLGRRIALLLVRALGRSTLLVGYATTLADTVLTAREIVLAVLVTGAIVLWVVGGSFVDATLTALVAIALMLVCGVVSWDDMAKNHAAWTTLMLLATLVTLADGLSRAGFVKWFAEFIAAHVGGFSPTLILVLLVTVYFFSHYMFASLTAHTTAMMPLMLAAGMGIPGLPAPALAMALALTTGIMGVITPYATGPGLAYYNSGYLPPTDFWRLGTIFGLIFLGLLAIGVPLLAMG